MKGQQTIDNRQQKCENGQRVCCRIKIWNADG